jgi:hypothetical protein
MSESVSGLTNGAGDYLVVGPDWQSQTPAGIKKVFRSSTQFSLAIYRTQLFNPDDMSNVGYLRRTARSIS